MKSLASVAASAGFTSLRIDRLALLAVVSLALIVRFYAIDVPSIWYDEAYSLVLARETPTGIWALTALDVHPPLYYVLLHYWMMFWGDGALPARALSALADVGTLLLCIKLMSLISTRRATWIAALFLALLPVSVGYSQNARMYTLLGFWLIGATVVLVCWAQAPEKKRWAVIYVLLMAAAFYTHYFAFLCVATHWLYWWKTHSERQDQAIGVRAWILVNGMIVLLYLPWLPVLIDQMVSRPDFGWIAPFTWQSVFTLMWQITGTSDSVDWSTWWRVWPSVFFFVCAVTVLMQDRDARRYGWLLVGYFFVPSMLLLAISLLKPAFVLRYFYFAAVALPLIVAVAIDKWWHRQRTLVLVLMAVFLLAEVNGVADLSRRRNHDVGLEALAIALNVQSRSGDEIVFDDLFWYLPFMNYNESGISPKICVGRTGERLSGYPDRSGWALIPAPRQSTLIDDESLRALDAERVWWITLKSKAEDLSLLSEQWIKVRSIDGGDIEARLFIHKRGPAQIGRP